MMRKALKRWFRLAVTGFAMGTADLIPGVSGGTIAFVSGVYEELIFSIKTVTGKTLVLLGQRSFWAAYRSVPWGFLVPLFLGVGAALFSLAGLLSVLLAGYGRLVWAFFFGLVAASVYIVAKRVVTWDRHDIVAFAVSSLFAYWLVGSGAIQTPHTLPMVFLSGMIAICAMILPGISGSFILVLLGQYAYMLESAAGRKFLVLSVFALGALLGISLFSRLINWLFSRHHDISIAILSGFMLGSLRMIWPFAEDGRLEFGHIGVWVLVLTGAALVLLLARYEGLKEAVKDVGDPGFEKAHKQALRSQQEHTL